MRAGEEFAGHRIESELGRGGMGVVYRARHLALDRDRALKVITPELSADDRFRARFAREARLAAQVEHPNVVPVHHAGDEAGRLYLSMRLVNGPDVADLVDADGPLDPRRAARIIRAVAAGLDAAHAHGLIHRDVKPSNVLVERGDSESIFITDFGISHSVAGDSRLTESGEFFGSPDYVAPEQIADEPGDRRTDVYSLGGLAHFLITGEPPFPRRTGPAKLVAHAAADRPRPSQVRPGLPAAVDEVIGRAMAVSPDERYPTAGELADAFEGALGIAPSTARAPVEATIRLPAARKRGVRRRRVLALGGGVVTAVAVAIVIVATGGQEARPGIAVGPAPNGVAVGESTLWASAHEDGTVWGINPSDTSAAPQVLPARAGKLRSIAVGFGSIWVVAGRAGEVVRLNPGEEGLTSTRIGVGEQPADVAVGTRWVWVTNEGDGTISRIDPARNAVDRTVALGGSPRAIATGEGGVWVADPEAGTVVRVDADQAEVPGEPIAVGRRASDLVVGDGSVWVTDSLTGVLRRIDIKHKALSGGAIRVGAEPLGVAYGFGDVWVANSADDTVTRVDADTRRVVDAAIPVGDGPNDVAVGFDSVWTANFGDDTVSRIEP